MSTPSFAASATSQASATRLGARAYSGVLGAAGGRELEALMRGDDPAALHVALYASPPYDLQVPALGVSRLSVTLTPARVSGHLDGDRARDFDTHRHALFLTPAGAAAHWRKASPSRHINIYFHAGAFRGDALEGLCAHDVATPLLNGSIPGLRGLAEQLATELHDSAPLAAEAVDSLARLLLIRVARGAHRRQDRRHPLNRATLTRLHDYVAAHLGERILVADMAAVVGMTPNHFAHVYSAHTGRSPHQFVLSQRLHRAMALLRASHLGLAEVAAACGFANQQHLSRALRQHVGMSPGRYRAAAASGSGVVPA
jgi:AraC family transcriptional regulator